jgi:hypothetical protein
LTKNEPLKKCSSVSTFPQGKIGGGLVKRGVGHILDNSQARFLKILSKKSPNPPVDHTLKNLNSSTSSSGTCSIVRKIQQKDK